MICLGLKKKIIESPVDEIEREEKALEAKFLLSSDEEEDSDDDKGTEVPVSDKKKKAIFRWQVISLVARNPALRRDRRQIIAEHTRVSMTVKHVAVAKRASSRLTVGGGSRPTTVL